MKIVEIEISVFEVPIHPAVTKVIEFGKPYRRRWKPAFPSGGKVPVQVIKVITDGGIDGFCTVGD